MQKKFFGGSQRNLIKAPREEGDFFERMMARIGRSWNPERLEHISQLGFRGRVFFFFRLSFHKDKQGAAFITGSGSEGLPPRVGPYRHHSYGQVRPPPL